MSLNEKIALMLTVGTFVVLAAVGVCVGKNSDDGLKTPEQDETETFRQNDPKTPDNADLDLYYEPNYITDAQPPFVDPEQDEVQDVLPALPGFLRPGIADDPEFAGDFTDAEPIPGTTAVPVETAGPTTEATTESAPVTTEPAPVTTTKPVTEPKKPETTQTTPVTETPEIPQIPEGADLRAAMVSVAISQIGVTEEPWNNVKYNTWFYGHEVCEAYRSATKYAWCGAFLAWCADQAGVPQSVFPKIASVSDLKNFFRNQDRYYTSGTPKVGDIVFFRTSHVGIVVSIEDGVVSVVEGNYSDKVSLNTYAVGTSKFTGYASPKY